MNCVSWKVCFQCSNFVLWNERDDGLYQIKLLVTRREREQLISRALWTPAKPSKIRFRASPEIAAQVM